MLPALFLGEILAYFELIYLWHGQLIIPSNQLLQILAVSIKLVW